MQLVEILLSVSAFVAIVIVVMVLNPRCLSLSVTVYDNLQQKEDTATYGGSVPS
jgi:hypothetical protein